MRRGLRRSMSGSWRIGRGSERRRVPSRKRSALVPAADVSLKKLQEALQEHLAQSLDSHMQSKVQDHALAYAKCQETAAGALFKVMRAGCLGVAALGRSSHLGSERQSALFNALPTDGDEHALFRALERLYAVLQDMSVATPPGVCGRLRARC